MMEIQQVGPNKRCDVCRKWYFIHCPMHCNPCKPWHFHPLSRWRAKQKSDMKDAVKNVRQEGTSEG